MCSELPEEECDPFPLIQCYNIIKVYNLQLSACINLHVVFCYVLNDQAMPFQMVIQLSYLTDVRLDTLNLCRYLLKQHDTS